ncbi:MAG: hypothetical protein MJ252_04480 [archaeon]|nr:hypothetical protein [archaeon]
MINIIYGLIGIILRIKSNSVINEDCPLGKWGTECQFDCDPACDIQKLNCDKSDGKCTYCNSTYYPSTEDPSKCLKCSSECKSECTYKGCNECLNEKHFGPWCDLICSNCKNSSKGYCDREGKCFDKCIQGYFTSYCNETCPLHCLFIGDENCFQDTGECEHCQKGFYPKSCEGCNDACSECISEDECTVCKDINKYGKLCNNTCNKNCFKDINQTESVCDISTGKCKSCIPGYYTDTCNTTCLEGCINCTQDKGECLQCKEDYYLKNKTCFKCGEYCDKCLNETYCIECKDPSKYSDLCNLTCPEHCSFNSSRKCDRKSGDCFSCEEYFEGNKCNNCVLGKYSDLCNKDCNKGCNLNISNCDRKEGNCTCLKGFWKSDCSSKCNENNEGCLECIQSDGKCILCESGYYLEDNKCIKCPSSCKGNCNKTYCSECNEGYYGDICQYNCSLHCINTTCNKSTGKCDGGCKEYFIGDKCDSCEFNRTGKECNNFCEFGCDLSDGINCDMETGNCTCKVGYFKGNCSSKCPDGCDLKRFNCEEEKGICYECKKGLFSDFCNETCIDKNCEECTQRTGLCINCKKDYFLTFNYTCEECPNSCLDKYCSSDGCEECTSLNTYGPFCNISCPSGCNTTDKSKTVCERYTGHCNEGCKAEHIIPYDTCDRCIDLYYDELCDKKCGEGCKNNCERYTAACSECLDGYYGKECNDTCPINCDLSKMNCDKKTGECFICKIRYFGPQCEECPKNCFDCENAENCTDCYEGFYGPGCQYNCSENCSRKECKKETGACESCKKGYYNSTCDLNCYGCNEYCFQNNGLCTDHNCKENYYDPLNGCNKECSEECLNGCDAFTGDCINCKSKEFFGPNCTYKCPIECEDDGRTECCYAKSGQTKKNINLNLKTFELNANDSDNFIYFQFSLGSQQVPILALVDFESNSQLVIFDKSTQYKEDGFKININASYDSKESVTYKKEEFNNYPKSTFNQMEGNGFQVTDKIYLNTNDKNQIEFTSKFLIVSELNVFVRLTGLKEINGIIGLGYLNSFCEDLLKEGIIEKNIIKYSKKTQSLTIGDYPKNMKASFERLTTVIPTQFVHYNDKIELKAKMQGLTYSLRKAYKLEKEISFSFTSNTSFSVPDSIYQIFFTKIYFGTLFNKGCYIKEKRRGVKEFYCDQDKFINAKFSSLGVVIDNYTYEFSKDLLFKKQGSEYKFLIELKENTQVVLGKDFFNEFEVIFNNGNRTLNFYGKTKKFTSDFSSTDDWNVLDDDELLSPGTWCLIIVFGIAFLIIIFYLNSYCFNSRRKDLGELEEEVLTEKEF